MKKFFITTIIFSIVTLISFAAKPKITMEKPDFEQIKAETINPDSDSYFPNLLNKYMSNDTLMTFKDYRDLYYGYLYQEDYNPYRVSEYSSKIDKLYYKDRHTKSECDTIMKYAELSLADNPFDLRQMTFLIIALKEKKKYARASIWQYRLNHLVAAILSSGNGTQEHPWYVISPNHEYNILNFMNMVAVEHESIGENLDYLKVARKLSKAPEGYYFDVSRVIEQYNKKFVDMPDTANN